MDDLLEAIPLPVELKREGRGAHRQAGEEPLPIALRFARPPHQKAAE
jgi:hypothetical protein